MEGRRSTQVILESVQGDISLDGLNTKDAIDTSKAAVDLKCWTMMALLEYLLLRFQYRELALEIRWLELDSNTCKQMTRDPQPPLCPYNPG
jgi:hypothetical protein